MNLSEQIRAYLAQHKRKDGTYRGRLLREIASGIGYPADPVKAERFHRDLGYSLARQVEDGYIDANHLSARKIEYAFICYPDPRTPMPDDVRKARKNERERARARLKNKKRGRSWSEYLEERRAAAALNASNRKANEAARRERLNAAKREQRAAARAARPPRPKAVPKPRVRNVTAIAAKLAEMRAPATAPKKEVPIESVAEWMARTGKKPEVLPLGAVSRPLRAITPKDLNDQSWQARQRRLGKAA